MQSANFTNLHFLLAFVSDGCTSGSHRPICGKLYKQVTSSTEHSFIWQVFNLVGVVDGRRVYVVAIFYQQSGEKRRNNIEDKRDLNKIG